jgi:16S rRNA A1518/A1519 N6-dimethyltransferase RsmA/KsgA/DIM1 with predicted DNA glycosylase/AP lyase activity
VIQKLFHAVSKAEIRQKAGETELNCGEIQSTGLTKVLAECRVTDEDVFVDVGSGIGNVISQVVLQCPVRLCIGVEIQARCVELSKRIIAQNALKYSRLRRLMLWNADVKDLSVLHIDRLQAVTILYANNLVFSESTQLVLEDLTCKLSSLKIVAVTMPFCTRHRSTCTRAFCTAFEAYKELEVEVHWKCSLQKLHLFRRKPSSGTPSSGR